MRSGQLARRARPNHGPAAPSALRRLSDRARNHAWPALAGLVLGLLALGPALASGFVLSYDMVFVPDPPLDRADLGFGGGPPRAVPSDLVVALMARIIPAQAISKLILIGIFVLACAGAAALVGAGWPDRTARTAPPLVARLAAGCCYAWNPFVAERLIMGQWALLIGYAGLPWVLREICARDKPIGLRRLAVAMVPAAVGGFAAMSITALAAVPTALWWTGAARDRGRRVAITTSVLAVASLPWVIPSLAIGVHTDPNAAAAFAARADTPFGAAGSLVMLGGIWNAQAVPAGYGGPASACWLAVVILAWAGYLIVARRRRICPGLGVAAVAGLCIAALGLTRPTLAALRAAIAFSPGFALLRDGQQFVAPAALAVSIGLGVAVAALSGMAGRDSAKAAAMPPIGPEPERQGVHRARTGAFRQGPATALGVLALLAPVCLLPGMAWGAVGRLQAVQYPADWLRARQIIESDRHAGSVLVLPWAQYRRYRWNHGEAVFDPWPRLLSRSVIWNDALAVGGMTVSAESPQARMLSPLIGSAKPLTGPLRAIGVRYVVVDAGPLLGHGRTGLAARARLPGARIVLASADLVLFRLPAEHASLP